MATDDKSLEPRDCPAAHSMDTTWFAVDRDGSVGVFDTSEHGAVPRRAAMVPEGGSIDSWPIDATLAAHALMQGRFPDDQDLPSELYEDPVVVVLRPDPDESPTTYRDAAGQTYSAQALLGEPILVLHETEPRIVCTLASLQPAAIRAIRSDAGVERALTAEQIWTWMGLGLPDGVHRYKANIFGLPGHYTRTLRATEPLTIDDLPSGAAAHVRELELPVEFARAEVIELADHFEDEECEVWGETTISGERRPRRSPGRRFPWLFVFVGAAFGQLLGRYLA